MRAEFSTIAMSLVLKKVFVFWSAGASISDPQRFDGSSSVVERLVHKQDELTTVFGDLRLSVDHSGTIRGLTLTCHAHARTGPEALVDSGPRNISYTTVAKFRRTRQLGGTSFKNTEAAETTAPSPFVSPGRIRLPIAIQLPVRMRMGVTLSLKTCFPKNLTVSVSECRRILRLQMHRHRLRKPIR